MNYLEIILQGYINENNREHLDKYFFREFKKAEIEYYENEEFFRGCLKVIKKFENNINNQFFDRKNELIKMLEGAKNGTIKYSDLKNKPIEQIHKETIDYCNKELLKINKNNFTVNLFLLTNGRITNKMKLHEVLSIKHSILKAKGKSTNSKQDIEKPQTFEELFCNFDDAEICLSILREVDPPIIDTENNYIGKAKGMFPLWIKVLKSNKPKPLIKHFQDSIYKDLLNSKIKGLNLTKDASEFRKIYKRLENDNKEIEIKTILSRYSQSGKLGK